MNVEKRAIRNELRFVRAQLSAEDVARAGARVLERLRVFVPYGTAAAVLAYLADDNEVPTAEVVEDVAASGRCLYLPKMTGGEAVLRWQPGEPLRAGPRGGIPEPVRGVEEPLPEPAVALVPLIAWDASGGRLGRGAGFYDRVLGRLPASTIRVGLAYEFQEHPGLPRDPWDVPLHHVITERRTVHCESAAPARDMSFQKGELRSE
jgi:5-formyltetrahydrofolate cyclo-ligase